MSATTQNPFRKSTRKPFAACQEQVLVFTKLGCSRRLAAEKAGCCHTTIGRAARRDPVFAAELEEAENHVDIASLTRINEAAAENKNWRAAAWILERRHPEEFGRRAPHSFSADQVMAVLAEVFAFTMPIVPPKEGGDFLRAFNRVMGRIEDNAKNADRWRNLAAGGGNRGKKPLRSPYEHPQWCDPDRPWTSKEESHEAIAWIHSLPKDDLDRVREIFYRDRAARKERASETTKARLLRLLVEEKAAETAAAVPADETAVDPAVDPPVKPAATVEPPTAAATIEPPVAVEELPPAAKEQNCPPVAVVQEDALAAETALPLTPADPAEHKPDTPAPRAVREGYIAPPTPAEHQACQEAAARRFAMLRHNVLLAQMLQQQAPATPPAANLAGGAYEARLQEWCEAMSR